MTTTLDDLIARLGAATGASRELDCLIRETLDKRYTSEMRAMHYGEPTGEHVTDDGWFVTPEYTGSLDAATTLMPEGVALDQLCDNWVFEEGRVMKTGGAACRLVSSHFERPVKTKTQAATPALALTIAALKARKAQP